MWAQLSLAFANLLAKIAPFLLAGLAYLKGKMDKEREISQNNLEKQKEYVEIRANKSGSLSDDLDRMQGGTY